MRKTFLYLSLAIVLNVAGPLLAVTNLSINPGFSDVDLDTNYGDSWGSFGAAGFHAFFGAGDPHASLFGDDAFNIGGVFQQSIPGGAGITYQFSMINTRIEMNWDADLKFGMEYYAADDATKLGETIVVADTATRLANGNVDGNVFSMQGTSPVGTTFVRPVISFDNVNPGYVAGVTNQANTFVFDSFLSEAPGIGDEYLKNPGFEDEDGGGTVGDYWGSYGGAGFNDFFSGNGHASLFSDLPGNSGGIFQQAILGTPGTTYEFSLTDVRIEDNFAADLSFGLEYFGDDDFTKLGDTIVAIDTDTGMVDGNSFTMSGTAVPGTKYVRPIVFYDNVVSTASTLENVYIFDATLMELSLAGLAGDYNGNDVIDSADYTVWRDAVIAGSTSLLNDPTPGTVNESDFTYWRDHYGDVLGSGSGSLSAAIPEPSSLALMVLAGLGIAISRVRR